MNKIQQTRRALYTKRGCCGREYEKDGFLFICGQRHSYDGYNKCKKCYPRAVKQGLNHQEMRVLYHLLTMLNYDQFIITQSHIHEKIRQFAQEQVNKGEKA